MREQSIVGKAGKLNVCFRDVTLSSHSFFLWCVAWLTDELTETRYTMTNHRETH